MKPALRKDNDQVVKIIRTNNYYTGLKAQTELGITYRPIVSAIEESSSRFSQRP